MDCSTHNSCIELCLRKAFLLPALLLKRYGLIIVIPNILFFRPKTDNTVKELIIKIIKKLLHSITYLFAHAYIARVGFCFVNYIGLSFNYKTISAMGVIFGFSGPFEETDALELRTAVGLSKIAEGYYEMLVEKFGISAGKLRTVLCLLMAIAVAFNLVMYESEDEDGKKKYRFTRMIFGN